MQYLYVNILLQWKKIQNYVIDLYETREFKANMNKFIPNIYVITYLIIIIIILLFNMIQNL